MSSSDKIIVLFGENEDYLFRPLRPASRFRKISKFSRVFKGRSSEGKEVVIKMLPDDRSKDPAEVENFKQEIRWYGVHPNLLAPFEYIYQDNRHYLVSDYVQAIDLGFYYRRIRSFRRKRIGLALECGLQLLDAVEALHNCGMIHADIKPANVLLLCNRTNRPDFRNPQFQLIDFGMVRPAGQSPLLRKNRSTRPFVLVYSPPEQVLGIHELTGFYSDLYNIALLMYEMITKEPAYESNISVKLMNLQTSFPLPESKVIPKPLMTILQKAAAKYHFKKPPNHYQRSEVVERLKEGLAERYQTADEFRQDLLSFKESYFGVSKT